MSEAWRVLVFRGLETWCWRGRNDVRSVSRWECLCFRGRKASLHVDHSACLRLHDGWYRRWLEMKRPVSQCFGSTVLLRAVPFRASSCSHFHYDNLAPFAPLPGR